MGTKRITVILSPNLSVSCFYQTLGKTKKGVKGSKSGLTRHDFSSKFLLSIIVLLKLTKYGKRYADDKVQYGPGHKITAILSS